MDEEQQRIYNKFWKAVNERNDYNSLTKYESKIIRKLYWEEVKGILPNKPYSNYNIRLEENNYKFLNNFKRVCIGNHGAYIEFEKEDCMMDLAITKGQEYRNHSNYYPKYLWMNPVIVGEHLNTKVYYQLRSVDYASYRVEHYYVSIDDLVFERKEV